MAGRVAEDMILSIILAILVVGWLAPILENSMAFAILFGVAVLLFNLILAKPANSLMGREYSRGEYSLAHILGFLIAIVVVLMLFGGGV